MRKRIIAATSRPPALVEPEWLQMDQIAEVELTSEDPEHPIETALLPGAGSGWRAADPGKQTVRLLFNRPQRLRRILLSFRETEVARTQEFVLRWSADGGASFREILRQQWNFSPDGSTSEVEEMQVDLVAVTVLELSIVPDVGGGETTATLAQLRLA